jgi:hypothetical protein
MRRLLFPRLDLLLDGIVTVLAVLFAAAAGDLGVATICRLTGGRAAAFGRVRQIGALVAAAGTAMVAVRSFAL